MKTQSPVNNDTGKPNLTPEEIVIKSRLQSAYKSLKDTIPNLLDFNVYFGEYRIKLSEIIGDQPS